MIRITLDEILAIKGKTKYWLAKETDINYQTLLLLQQNKTISIRFETLEKICIALNCTPNDIIKVEVEK
ncbi:helix-turn-helix domain-containing protein [Thomasclavelia cocleata]|uniref:helix-turn-helix domain-containing protein n=1 Tax=Thomasclavelia cocleata TaxID=69824 RepID=UPI00242DB38B|nr:helix-turn-helix domain-containing protein [Thomasclavelia cocleata]